MPYLSATPPQPAKKRYRLPTKNKIPADYCTIPSAYSLRLSLIHKTQLDISYKTKLNKADIVSFVLTEITSPEHAAHPTTAVKGYIFSLTEGRQLTLKDFDKTSAAINLPDAYSLASINQAITRQFATKGITPLPEFKGPKDRPSEIYLDTNMHLHALLQPMEIAPYAAGVIDIDLDAK